MKFIVKRFVVAVLLVTLAGSAAFGKSRRTTISFNVDTKVDGTLIKRGTYEVVFEEQSGELSIRKGSKVVVSTATRLEKRSRRVNDTEFTTIREGMEMKLVSITFGGSDQNVVVNQAAMQAGGN